MRRSLPIFIERSIQHMQADRFELGDDFERKILGESIVTCKKGCTSCCYHPLLITILEAIPIYGSLVEHGRWVPSLKDKLRKAASLTTGRDLSVWLLSKIPCPLLSAKGLCTSYEARPFACRATMATGDPYYCDPQRLGDQKTILPRIDIMRSFHAREAALLRKHNLLHLTMPIGRAVLLAEQVCSGTIRLEDIDRTYVTEHLG